NQDDRLVYVLMGDGEQQEGQVWEAAMYGAHYGVDNLIATIDFNRQQIDGPTKDVMDLKDLKAKWEAFGWEVVETVEGNNMEAVLAGLEKAKSLTGKGKPVLNLLHTEMGYGVDFMVGTHKWHGIAPSDEQLANALGQLEETLGDY
ncbi:MAG: transketolase, partial [Belliella pelovolcani]